MRGGLLILVLMALLVSGCGVLDDEGPATQATPDPAVYGPSHATGNDSPTSRELPPPPTVKPSTQVADALAAGGVGIVGITGVVAIEPESLDTAADVTVTGLRWTTWDVAGATGEGRMTVPTCQPTCASGATEDFPAQVVLSGAKVCDGRRYFDHAEVRIDPRDAPSGLQPASYLRAPC
jgi:hypothetical protein